MTLLDVKSCLVCETARPEPFGKMSLLGFYGAVPDVEIRSQDPTKLLRLTFVLLSGLSEKSAQYAIEFSINNQRGEPIVPVLKGEVVAEKRKRLTLALEFTGVFPEGSYKVILSADGQKEFDGTFFVTRGQPEDFR